MKFSPTALLVPVATIALALVLPSTALAASPAQVIRDARDGRIDGKYTAAELRAADAQITAQEREYTDWDYLFQNALRRIANPDLPQAETVPVRDYDGDGVISDSDVKEAEKRKARAKKKNKKDEKDSKDDEEAVAADDEGDDDPVEARSVDPDDDEGGNPWLIALLIAIPLGIVGVGVWRMQQAQSKDLAAQDDAADAPTSSFSVGDDEQ